MGLIIITQKAIDLGFGIWNLILTVFRKYVKLLDVVFIGFLSYWAPRVTGIGILNIHYAIWDKLADLVGNKAIVFAIFSATIYLLYFVAWKKYYDKKNYSDVMKYIIAFPICMIVTIGLYQYSQMIQTDDADLARVFFYIVIFVFNLFHYGTYIYQDFIRKPFSRQLHKYYSKKLDRAYKRLDVLDQKKMNIEIAMSNTKHR